MPVKTFADAHLKPAPLDVEFPSPKACKQDLCDLDDMVRVCDAVDANSPIFSTVGSPDDVDSTTGDELGDYELSYLHNMYQGDLQDSMLPDAPTSLSMMPLSSGPASSALKANALAAIALKNPASGAHALSQPDTPPGGGHDSLDDSDDDMTPSPRGASPVPSGPAAKSTPVRASANSRKRKGASAEAPALSSPLSKACKTSAARERACSPVDVDTPRSSRDSSECPSTRPMLDGMEIRPEDDPLGLFSRDPATLTPEEQRLLKKQRRLLKNRESAQLSRHRKKCHLHTLEKQVDSLKKEKAVLQQRVQELLDENERLRKGM
jgi:hypothetical protein|eukprot:Tamp_06183.p3 GENE.Tamp_06183~~Tamp_06183.p3  ORF type:complete len:322 (+),score=98.95 Tamp_06183:115-1080(+)